MKIIKRSTEAGGTDSTVPLEIAWPVMVRLVALTRSMARSNHAPTRLEICSMIEERLTDLEGVEFTE